MRRTTDVLAARERDRARNNPTMRTGIVQTVEPDGQLTLLLGDSTVTNVPRLASYSAPAQGHAVIALVTGSQVLVLGRIATS